MSDDRRLVSSSVAARELGVHYSALSRWAKEGKVTPAHRTAGGERGGHYRWDMDDLRRQLQANQESAALDPIRASYTAAVALIATIDDLHAALAVLGKLVDALQVMLDGSLAQRSRMVERIYEQDALALKPLADKISTSAARRRGR